MGTFHSFISEPIYKKEEAEKLKSEIDAIIQEEKYMHPVRECYIQAIGGFFVVYGIFKNLGYSPFELENFESNIRVATVSDENDWLQIGKE